MTDSGSANGWMLFVSSLVGDLLSWPVIVLLIFFMIKGPVRDLIPKLKSFEGMGQKLTFGEQLAATEEAAAAAVSESGQSGEGEGPGNGDEELSPLIREAEQNPSFVIISAWELLNAALRDAGAAVAAQLYPDQRAATNASSVVRQLQQLDLVNEDFTRAVNELRDLRNQVAHGAHNPSPGEAVTFAETVNELVRATTYVVRLLPQNQTRAAPDSQADR